MGDWNFTREPGESDAKLRERIAKTVNEQQCGITPVVRHGLGGVWLPCSRPKGHQGPCANKIRCLARRGTQCTYAQGHLGGCSWTKTTVRCGNPSSEPDLYAPCVLEKGHGGMCDRPAIPAVPAEPGKVHVFSPDKVKVTFNGKELKGYMDGTAIEVAHSWKCANRGCPERAPVVFDNAPTCYTCGQKMEKVS